MLGVENRYRDTLAARQHAYMSPALLESQLATLETPRQALAIVNDRAPELIAAEILRGIAGAHGVSVSGG